MSLHLACALFFLAGPGPSIRDQIDEIDRLCAGSPAQVREAMTRLEDLAKEAKRCPDLKPFVRWKQGWCKFLLGDPVQARKDIAEAIDQGLPRHPCLALMYRDLGQVYLQDRQAREAAPLLQKALAAAAIKGVICPVEEELVRIRLRSAECQVILGKDAEARKQLDPEEKRIQAVMDGARRQSRPVPAAWASLHAECQLQLAELDRKVNLMRANERLESGLKVLKGQNTRDASNLRLRCHVNIAMNLWRLARFDDADRQLDQAKTATERDAAALDEQRAALRIEKSIVAFEQNPKAPDLLKQLGEAERYARSARNYYEKRGGSPVFTGTQLFNLAQVSELRGQVFEATGKAPEARAEYLEGRERCDKALRLLSSVFPADHDYLLEVRRKRAWLCLRLGEYDAAREEADGALKLFLQGHGAKDVDGGLFHHLLLEIEDRAGNAAAAARHADAHRRLSAGHLVAYIAPLTAPEQINFFRKWDDPGLHASLRLGLHYKSLRAASADWLINGKAKCAEVLAEVNLQQRGTKSYQEFQRAIAEQAYLLYGPAGDAAARQRRLLELESDKREWAADQAAVAPERWYALDDLCRHLLDDEVYIDVCSLRPRAGAPRAYYAWVITATGPVQVVELGNADSIDRLVGTFQEHMEKAPGPKGLFATLGPPEAESKLRRDCLDALSERLLKPLLPLAAGKKRWVVSPDGPLWNIPWGALILPGSDRYAIEEYTFRYMISGRDLVRQPKREQQPRDPWIVADPDLNYAPAGVRGGPRPKGDPLLLPPLPAARQEGRLVADCLKLFFHQGATRVLTGDRATKAAFLALAESGPPRVVYLSTHGFFSLPTTLRADARPQVDPLLCCAVAVAGCNFLPAQGHELPGLLTGAEVLAVDLTGTDLVVLSACQSGTGVTSYGQSPADLRHAFHLAGARAVVSSLWSVEDEATRELMVAFMNAYRQPGTKKADALVEAQRAMIRKLRQGEDHCAHPFFWAAFTLSGS